MTRIAALAAALVALSPAAVYAQEAPAAAPRVGAVRFAGETEHDLDGLDVDVLKGLVTVYPGRSFDGADLRESFANLYQTGKFDTVRAATAPHDGVVDVVFTVRRVRLITGWSFRGNKALNAQALERAMDLSWGMVFDPARFAGWSRAIRERYLREGFPNARADFRFSNAGADRTEVEVQIAEGEPVRVRKVAVEADADEAGGIRRAFGLKEGDRLAREPFFTGVDAVEQARAKAGWLDGRVSWYLTMPDGQRATNLGEAVAAAPAYVDLTITVDRGNRAEIIVQTDPEGDKLLKPINELAKAVTIFERHSISPGEIDATRDSLRARYVGEGYADARVGQETSKLPDGRYRVVFTVDKGVRRAVERVDFAGNKAFDAEALRGVLGTKGRGRFFGGSYFDPAVWSDDMANLETFYHRKGFLAAKVAGVERVEDPETHALTLRVSVEEGPRTIIQRIVFPSNLTPLQRLDALQSLPIDPGEPYDPRRLPEWTAAVQSYFAKTGYPLAQVDATLDARPDPSKAVLHFDVELGPPKRVGRVVIRGNVKTVDSVVRRQITVKPGDPYDAEELFRTQQQIYQLGFFDRVSVEPIGRVTRDPNDPVDLVVALHERETGWIGVGGGYGQAQGPQASAEFQQNNIGGTGRPLRLEGVFSAPRSSFVASLRDPYLLGSNLIGETGFSYIRERRRPGEPLYQTYGPTIGVSRQLFPSVFGSLKYGWGQTNYLEPESLTEAQLRQIGGLINRTNSVFTAGLTYDTRSDILNPRYGTRADVNVDLGTPLLAGSLTYVRPRATAAYYWPFPRKVVLALGAELGFIQTIPGYQPIPTDLRFVAGGGSSLRGYGLNTVYPPGFPDGGRMLGVGHVELRVPIVGDLGGVVFSDFGDVWAQPQEFNPLRLKTTAGLGVRYNTPVGPVRLDYGFRILPGFEVPGWDGLFVGLGHAF